MTAIIQASTIKAFALFKFSVLPETATFKLPHDNDRPARS